MVKSLFKFLRNALVNPFNLRNGLEFLFPVVFHSRAVNGAGGSEGKHISITVRAIYLKAPGPFQKFLAPVLKDQMSVCSLKSIRTN